MSNMKRWLLEAEAHFKEPIEQVMVGAHDRSGRISMTLHGALMDRESALRHLDREFDPRDWIADSRPPPLYAWSATRVFFLVDDDGEMSLESLPRHPTPARPAWRLRPEPLNELRPG